LCPGCGGRNDPTARECEWCGRLFIAERRQVSMRWLAPAGVIAVLLLMFGAVTFALVGSRSADRPSSQTPSSPTALPDQDDEPEVAAFLEPPTRQVAPTPFPTEVEQRVEFVIIANTGGTGAFIRREARAGAPGIVAYRDGIILRIVGPDTTTEGRAWRNVEDRQGNRGWTPREYLATSATGF